MKENNTNNKKKTKIIMTIIGVLVILIAGVCVTETIKMNNLKEKLNQQTRENILQESIRYEMINNDLLVLRKEIMNMNNKHINSESKTEIISVLDNLIKKLNEKEDRPYLELQDLGEILKNSDAYLSEEQVDDFLGRFQYMLESMAILSRITIEEAEQLAVIYGEAIQQMGLNDAMIDFSEALTNALIDNK